MINEMVVGAIILLVGIIALIFYPVIITLVIGLICFALISFMIGSVVREFMPGYRGR
jgi:hypothetical protein